ATPTSPVVAGNRLVVQVVTWSSGGIAFNSVTDTAGNTYTKLIDFAAPNHGQMSIWTAPITAGGGTQPTVTATPSGTAHMGTTVLEHPGLSLAAGTGVLDVSKTATGTSTVGTTVSSGMTAATTGSNELALGFYGDSGFGDTLTPGTGFTQRANVAPGSDVEFLAEDQIATAAGSRPNASARIASGVTTTWLMATVVLKHA